MHSRERVKRAIHFQTPDLPPLLHGLVGGVRTLDFAWASDLASRYPDDFGFGRESTLPGVNRQFFLRGDPFIDAWGCTRQCSRDGLQSSILRHPIETESDLDRYTPPPLGPQDFAGLQEQLTASGHPLYAVATVHGFFDGMANLYGMENLFCALADEDSAVPRRLADIVNAYIMRSLELICTTDVDAVFMCDDWGTEISLMISPDLWRTFFKPHYQRFIDYAHAHGKDFWLHSCGHILPLIPDFIELGVDVLHPQLEMFLATPGFLPQIRGKLCVITDVDRHFLGVASPEQVYDRALSVFRTLYQPEGGMILRGEIGISVPHENAEAFYRACRDFQNSVIQ
jgi:uroporphyrinogen decarboxylase